MSAVELTPFQHKVGGNSYLFVYDEETVSKPFVAREYYFYKHAPAPLLPFLPLFKGIADVRFDDGLHGRNAGFYAMTVRPSLSVNETQEQSLEQKLYGTIRTVNSDKEIIASSTSKSLGLQRMNNHTPTSCELVLNRVPCQNHFAMHFSEDSLLQLKDVFHASQKHGNKIMLLENIISHHRRPCVMDIKVGTRLYHDDMTEEKKQLSIWRCNVSTSKDLALRVGGIKVYRSVDDCYLVMDKYAGRTLNADGFCKAVELFFDIDETTRENVLCQMIAKLELLHDAVLSASTQTRLYACSVLLVYDGDSMLKDHRDTTDVKIIDFENASIAMEGCENPSDGCLLGIENLIDILKKMI